MDRSLSRHGSVRQLCLKHAGEKATAEDYRKALADAPAPSRESVLSIPSPDGFEYVHTQTASWKGRVSNGTKSGGALGSALVLPGGLPPGWNVTGDVDV